MPLARFVFYKRNRQRPEDASAFLRSVLHSCSEFSTASGLTGALVFNDKFIMQAMEGERGQVTKQLRAAMLEDLSEEVTILGLLPIDMRMFEGWSVGYASRKLSEAERIYLRYGATQELDPFHMTMDGMCGFLSEFSKLETPFVQHANAQTVPKPRPPEGPVEHIKVTRLDQALTR